MKKKAYRKILRQIAKQHGVRVKEVERDMDLALKEAQANPDPAARAKWASIPRKGSTPTTEEVITYLASEVGRKIDNLG